MTTVTAGWLQTVDALKDVPVSQLQWFIDNSEQYHYPVGNTWFKAGDAVPGTHIVISGRAKLYLQQHNDMVELMTLEPHSITGYLPFSRMTKAAASCDVVEEMQVLTFPREKIDDLIHHHFELTQALVHVMTSRVRDFTSLQQQSEKMMALGKLSAGLTHELNNPASAVLRGARSLKQHLQLVPDVFKALMNLQLSETQVDAVNNIMFEVIHQGPPPPMGMLERSDKTDELLDILDKYKVDNAMDIAENMVDFGFSDVHIEQFNQHIPPNAVSPVLNWINTNLVTEKMVTDIEEAAARISKLVDSVKSFTHMDQGQDKSWIDVHTGLQSTLNMLEYKLRKGNIEVNRNFDTSLPQISAFAGELNQVWTNIIDNAIDAMEPNGKGQITVTTAMDGKCLAVTVTDNGPGISPEIKDKIFDPFFTTKDIGKGTGMGLDIVAQIIRHHRGNYKVNSEPGNTTFTVLLPLHD
ncbi:ATP-binding protein [Chitinophaga sp. sic0106]|uniref:ATP-binding protein n=1 Tax=Chitinophaga sp. sic0106 TaxID=2854785 RepID=UPI001C469A9D|nr:ATP-binding protein [Chitinophaga sp. sic0106]MBV7529123.1 cyclic nucleotide-binding domain-containing protein [Chitinophaga sp. sic0106]